MTSCVDDSTGPDGDVIPPARIDDLRVEAADESTAVIRWTAPGDDDTTGTAMRYDLRFSPDSLSETNWPSAIPCDSVPLPGPAGTGEETRQGGLSPGSRVHFALRSEDDSGNRSALSPSVTLDLPGTEPKCWLTDDELDFRSIHAGSTWDIAFEIMNRGGGTLAGEVVAPGCPDFAVIAGTGPYRLRHGERHGVTVRFAPGLGGEKFCRVPLGESPGCRWVDCYGYCIGPVCDLSADTLDFGDVALGDFRLLSLEVINRGEEAFFGRASMDSEDFELVYGTGIFQVDPGERQILIVAFHPRAEGPAEAVLETGFPGCPDATCVGRGISP